MDDADYRLNMQFIRMPSNIKATVTINEDDSYTIFVNKNLSVESQIKGAIHELKHIRRGDFFSEQSIDEIEREIKEAENE